MHVILLGPPGAGKGTQASIISKLHHVIQLSTGNMLRQVAANRSAVGMKIKTLMAAGSLLPDNTIIAMVQEYLESNKDQKGFLFDGFPRTLAQAEALEQVDVKINYVINLQVDDDLIIARLSGRRVHLASGRTYHILYNPPKQENLDDVTGEKLVTRADDEPDAIRHRLNVFHQENNKLISYYKNLATQGDTRYIDIDGTDNIANITAAIVKFIGK